jgi:colanic acid/amylovoran biosynthesis protein
MTSVFVADNVPSLNKGEMTILEGMLVTFEALGETEVSMVSCYSKIDGPRYGKKIKMIDPCEALGIPSAPDNLKRRLYASSVSLLEHVVFMMLYKVLRKRAFSVMRGQIWKDYADCDIVIVGHDGGFGPWGGELIPLYLYPVYITLLTRALRKPTVIYGASAPTIKRLPRLSKFLTRVVLNGADLITMREEPSAVYLRSIGVNNPRLTVTADPAFLLRPAPAEAVREMMLRENIDPSRTLIGLTVTRDIASHSFPALGRQESYRKHIEMLAQVADHLADELNATVIFVPHCLGYVRDADERDDRIVGRDILQRCLRKDRVKVVSNEYSPAVLKGLLGRCDLFLGERLHSVVNAMSMCVPSLVMSVPDDVRLNIIRMLGQGEAVCLVENLDAASLIAKVRALWDNRQATRDQLSLQVKAIQKVSMRNGELLKEMLDSRK